jgi:hypothetical protein
VTTLTGFNCFKVGVALTTDGNRECLHAALVSDREHGIVTGRDGIFKAGDVGHLDAG